jgi:hypothetical protein
LNEVARKPKGKRNVPKDCFGVLDEFKTNLLTVLFSCDKFGCIDYFQHHCYLCIGRKGEHKDMNFFMGQIKLLRDEKLKNMETQNMKQNHHHTWSSFLSSFVFYLSNFQTHKKNKRLKSGEKKPLLVDR